MSSFVLELLQQATRVQLSFPLSLLPDVCRCWRLAYNSCCHLSAHFIAFGQFCSWLFVNCHVLVIRNFQICINLCVMWHHTYLHHQSESVLYMYVSVIAVTIIVLVEYDILFHGVQRISEMKTGSVSVILRILYDLVAYCNARLLSANLYTKIATGGVSLLPCQRSDQKDTQRLT